MKFVRWPQHFEVGRRPQVSLNQIWGQLYSIMLEKKAFWDQAVFRKAKFWRWPQNMHFWRWPQFKAVLRTA